MKRTQETLSCELRDTYLADPLPSSSPSPNSIGIKGGRPFQKPKSSFERKCSTVSLNSMVPNSKPLSAKLKEPDSA
ncbi:kinesin-like protein KIN12B [Cucumis melo var. makuwa]|uniref:Kinesin-like protein KIN12B n=2 Tax=Cucumis melo TaxID=3656 RepID=A0A5A7UMR4_CUCMM|nr:kinesin-like protein KIN12B [Cucumis melo var. makuwa]TYK29130.1 kinesin-like protein KIN12B [Cucumis melo var. makuwa]